VIVGRKLGLQGEALINAKLRILEIGLIDNEWQPRAWGKRQFLSDHDNTNAERQKRFRDNKRNAPSNVTVTPPDTDTDTDTDKTLLSDKSDATPKNLSLKPQAIEVLEELNKLTDRHYRPVPANLEMITARLKEGFTVQDLKDVILDRCQEWYQDPKMSQYIRPKTIFNKTNCANYQGGIRK